MSGIEWFIAVCVLLWLVCAMGLCHALWSDWP